MFDIHKIGKGLTGLVFEQSDEETAPTTSTPNVPVVAALPTWSPMPTVSVAPVTSNPEAVLAFNQHLDAVTSLENTDVGKTLTAALATLEGLPVADSVKLQTALKVGADKGLSAATIMAAIDGLYTNLSNEAQSFQTALDAKVAQEITGRQTQIQNLADQIKSLQSQITDLQVQQTQISADLIKKQTEISSVKLQFEASLGNHKTQLDQLKAKYVALLA